MARFVSVTVPAALATVLFFFAAALSAPTPTLAQPVTVTVPQPPAWIYNKTEWRSRLYNSLRLTQAQVDVLEVVLDARDALKAPLKNATWNAAEVATARARAVLRQRNNTLTRALVKQLLYAENATVIAMASMKENALNKTEIVLREASKAAAASGGVQSPISIAATLIAKALNLTADAVDRQLQDLLTVQQYREAAWRSKLQAEQLSTAEEQGAFATLGSFAQTVAPVTTPPAPISAPVGGGPLSPQEAAAAAAVAKEASVLPMKETDPATSTTVVHDTSGAADSASASVPMNATTTPTTTPTTAVFAKVARGESSSSSAAASPHPASLVDEADGEIASWLSERPLEAGSVDESEHLNKVAAWISAAPEDELLSRSSSAAAEAAELDDEVASYGSQAESVLAGVASSEVSPKGGVTSPEVAAEANDEDGAKPVFALPSSLSPSAARYFFRRQYPNGTITRSTPGGLAPSEAPSSAVGAPTYPATSLDAQAIQASPAIKDYYRYLALRAMGFSKVLSATAVAATGDRSLSTAIKYCLTTLKIELADGVQPVWVGQSATPYVIPQTGTVNSFAAQSSQQGGKKKRRSLFSAVPAPLKEASADDATATADEAVPAAPVSSSSSGSASTNARKLFNFGTNTSPPPPPSPPPPGPSPPPPSPPGPPAFGTYVSYRADNTAVSRQLNGVSSDPPDGGLCAGGGYIISMANEVASVRAQSDPATALRTVKLFDFYQGTSGDSFGDPHCIYHAPSGRFFAVAYQTTSTLATYIPLAMSSINDPLGTWTVYRINSWNNVAAGLSGCNAQTPCFGDYPQIGSNQDSVWVSSNQFAQSGSNLNFVGMLLTALSISNLVAGGTQTPFQTGTSAIGSVKPMVVSGPAASYPSGTMYLLATQTSTSLRLLTYTNTGNLASNSAPTLARQRTVTSSISIGGAGSYSSSPTLSSGTAFDGGDNRLIGLSYANGRMLASATTFYGSTAASPKLGVVYWFIDVDSATQVYAGVFADASWNAWSMSTVLDPNNVNRGFAAGMIATYPGYTLAFPTASVLATLQVNSGSPNSAALVSSQDGQYLRGFTNPLRTGDYSTSALDPATGVAWLLSEQGQTYSTTSSNNWGTVVWKASFT